MDTTWVGRLVRAGHARLEQSEIVQVHVEVVIETGGETCGLELDLPRPVETPLQQSKVNLIDVAVAIDVGPRTPTTCIRHMLARK